MPGVVNVGKNAMDVRKSVAQSPYSRVVITVDEETEYTAGNTSGETLELECPWGTQQMANNILANIRGYQYQPYTATTAIVEPSAEIGDAVQANGVYGGMYQQDSTFGSTFYSDFSAPTDEQLDHEFTYVSPTERRITRQKLWAKSEFKITNKAITQEVEDRSKDSEEFRGKLETHADEIAARVTQTGGTNSSFGWSLVSTGFGLYSGNKRVFFCNKDGISVDGSITARSGYIGNGNSGFTIGSTFIRNGMTSFTDTTNNGVYVGTNGIALGKGTFKVTNGGALTSTSADIKGKVTATSGYIGNGTSGFEIGNTYIRNGVTSLSDASHDGIYLGTNGIRLGKGVFTVTNAGKLTCTNVDVSGKITATSGSFSGELKSATGKFAGELVAATGTFKGVLSAATGTFKGELSAATGSFSGKITASSGTIGSGSEPWNIGTNCIYRGKASFGATEAGIYIGKDGIALGAGAKSGNTWLYTAPFKVDANGNIYAKSGTFGGTVYLGSLAFTDKDGNTVTIDGSKLTDGTIGNAKIGDGAVTGAKIGDGEIGNSKISDGAVGNSKIGDGSVTEGKIGSGAVTGGKIGNKAVSKGKTSDNVQTSLSNGDTAFDNYTKLTTGTSIAGRLKTGELIINNGKGSWDLSIGSHTMKFVTITVSGSTYHVLGY